jgi:ComF family protein
VLARLVDFVFPSGCCGCSSPGSPLCSDCAPRPAATRRLRFDDLSVVAAGPYAGALRRTILAFKHGRRDAGDALASLLAERVAARLPSELVFVPVPTAARRRRERGFDQGVRLARRCGETTGHAVLVALHKPHADAQRGRGRTARLRAQGRFVCAAPGLVRGMRIVLVDDVVTTGATLRDCAATLRECGAVVHQAIVLAYA